MPPMPKIVVGTALATFVVTLSPMSLAVPSTADGLVSTGASRGDGSDAAARTRAVRDRKGDALGAGFDIRRLVVRNKPGTIRVKVAMYKGRARAAYAAVAIDPAPRGGNRYDASITMNRRGNPTDVSLNRYRGHRFVGAVRCKKFRAGYFFNKSKKRYSFSFRVPYRCVRKAKKTQFMANTQNTTEYGYDRTRKVTVRRG